MEPIRRLRNEIREYAWGSRTELAELLGEPTPASVPQAELWMGAHPAAPSHVQVGPDEISLVQWLRERSSDRLGAGVVERFGDGLPFLLKVLASERPLSLQAHPNAEQARAGFEREEALGIARDAPERSYRDPNPKPELICALTPFTALCGFRAYGDLLAQVDELRAHRLAALVAPIRLEPTSERLREFYAGLLGLAAADAAALVEDVVVAAETGNGDPAIRGWLRKLAAAYPGDPGVLAPIFLNLLELAPGEALYLPAGQLHAYLHGTAIEIMASSDNVLRGGLTAKHVDVPELLATLDFSPRIPEVLTPVSAATAQAVYATPAREFELSLLTPEAGRPFESGPRDSVEILFCSRGAVVIEGETPEAVTPETASLERGAAVLVPATAGAYRLVGDARIHRATVPLGSLGSRRS
jgi:mannose-6-phosphate isomerase